MRSGASSGGKAPRVGGDLPSRLKSHRARGPSLVTRSAEQRQPPSEPGPPKAGLMRLEILFQPASGPRPLCILKGA